MESNYSETAQAAERFLNSIENAAPKLHALISADLAHTGMGAMGDIWDTISNSIEKLTDLAPGIYMSREEAKRDLKIAENTAAFQLQQAKNQIEEQRLINETAFIQYQRQQDLARMEEARAEEKRLLAEEYKADSIISRLSGTQWAALGVAGLLTFMLLTGKFA